MRPLAVRSIPAISPFIRALQSWRSCCAIAAIAACFTPLTGQAQPTCTFSSGQSFNRFQAETTTDNGETVVVIGRLVDQPYVVIVPGDDPVLLNEVRQCISTAFVTESRLGSYVYVASFENRTQAESLVWLLRSRDLDARVVDL